MEMPLPQHLPVDVIHLFSELSRLGVQVIPRGNGLEWKAPRGGVTPELQGALVRNRSLLLAILSADLLPKGWIPSAWHGRLLQLAKCCENHAHAQELRAKATVVAVRYGLTEDSSEAVSKENS